MVKVFYSSTIKINLGKIVGYYAKYFCLFTYCKWDAASENISEFWCFKYWHWCLENWYFDQIYCLPNILLHCEFSLCMERTSKFGQNNCLTSNFLHCEFLLFMFCSLKDLFWEGQFRGLPPGGTSNLVRRIVSQNTSYIVSFNFLC